MPELPNVMPDETCPGTVLAGTYRIVSPIAEGGCGEVHAADHTRLPGKFAVKLLHRSYLDNPDAQARFRQEAEITSTLRHPNIVQIVDFNVTEAGRPFLVMELIEGELLSERLTRTGALPPAEVARIVEQMARALLAAHERGIVHRDLKPDNVMLTSVDGCDDFVKVLDFGISQASWRSDPKGSGEILGTPQYMAPEQALGQSDRIGPWTDQWSLATIAYALLTGREPFQGDSVNAVLVAVAHREPTPPSEVAPTIGPEVSAVILRGLSKNPIHRYEDVVLFAAALRDAIEQEGTLVAAAPASLAAPAVLPAMQSGRVVAAAAQAPSDDDLGTETLRVIRSAGLDRGRFARRLTVAGAVAAALLFLMSPTRTPGGASGAIHTAKVQAHAVFARAALELPDAAVRLSGRVAAFLAR